MDSVKFRDENPRILVTLLTKPRHCCVTSKWGKKIFSYDGTTSSHSQTPNRHLNALSPAANLPWSSLLIPERHSANDFVDQGQDNL